ncbi:MAG: DNA-binding Lrp family transcriptional regulator [Gammaproteobacteria bacterium]|jgi:DNA-binding Lrp family transcriptional regulator
MATAIILITAVRGEVTRVGEELAALPEVSEVYSVAGNFDLVALVRVPEHEDLATLATQKMPTIAGIERTETLIAFRSYSRHDLESLFSVGM